MVLRALQALSMISCLHMMGVVSFLPPREYVSRPIIVTNIIPASENGATVSSLRQSSLSAPFQKSSQKSRRPSYTAIFSQPSSSSPATKTSGDNDEEMEELTPATIAEMIEVAFLQSCLQLSQG